MSLPYIKLYNLSNINITEHKVIRIPEVSWNGWFGLCHFILISDRQFGETLVMRKVQRDQMGAYLCIASNDVPPAVSKRVILNVNCK